MPHVRCIKTPLRTARIAGAVIFLSVGGCARQAVNSPVGPSTLPSALPLEWASLHFADSQPLAAVSATGTVELVFKIKPPLVEHTLFFGELQNSDEQTIPLVVRKDKGQFRALRMGKEGSFDQWQRVIAGPAAGEVWAVMDQAEANRGNALSLAHTLDNGATWQVTTLRKPCDSAAFYDMLMSSDGIGRLTLTLIDDCESNTRLKAGLYHYRTRNGGQTWLTPQFEADDTHPGDDATEDDQPGNGQIASGPHPTPSDIAAR